ncbi:MAG: helix-turn-helix transcriptional regulator [Pseudomonadota bacterium]
MLDLCAHARTGGFKFCIATGRGRGLLVLSVMAGGDLAAAEGTLPGRWLEDPEDPLFRAYRSPDPVLWSGYLRRRRPAPAPAPAPAPTSAGIAIGEMAALGPTCGASLPIVSRAGRKRASLCISGEAGEAPEAFDRRFPEIFPTLRLAALTLLNFALERAERQARRDLTHSEVAVIERLADGLRPQRIAAELGKSETTIRNQVASIRVKLGARSALEAVAIWNMRTP